MRVHRTLPLLLAVVGPILLARSAGPGAALESITARELSAHVRFLSDDLLEGRAPGTRGGDVAALYIASEFARLGLEPVGDDYLQPVPLVGSTPAGRAILAFHAGGRYLPADSPEDLVVWSGRPDTAVAGDVVFAGYGTRAPEHRWDDFEGRDVSGKILLVLAGDPPAPPDEPALFDGPALTYYGRWTYKLEEAARQGAAGALIVHTAGAAGYPWSVVRSSWTGERLALPPGRDDPPPLPLEGWIRDGFARTLLAAAGLDLDELRVRAARRDFTPVPTGLTLRASLSRRVRPIRTFNVVGLLRGSDPERRDQVVIYTAHYDHLGIGMPVGGDSIYNGAYDNAGGVSVLVEIAGAFARLEPRPARSILFIATTAEEAGLLGSTHYVRHPLVPLRRTAAALNVDGANLWGETDDITALGADRSTLGRTAEASAHSLGLRLTGDRAPERGLFFRSDHFPFARAGVPALSIQHGIEFRGRPIGWGTRVLEAYHAHDYHQPSDELDLAADLTGAVQQARFAFLVGYDVAQADSMPE